MKVVRNGKRVTLAPTMVRGRGSDGKFKPAWWDCGWHVKGVDQIFGHRAFQQYYERALSKEVPHQLDYVDQERRTWRRAIDHIWYEHPDWGLVISRVNDGTFAIIRSRHDDHYLDAVPLRDLTEVPRFESCARPPCHTTTRCTSKRSGQVKKPQRDVKAILKEVGIDLDELMKGLENYE